MDFDKAKEFLGQHDEQVDSALEKAGEFAKGKFEGQEGMIDKAVDFGQNYDFGGDQPAEEPPAEPPAQ